jgi:hypothetical protein
MTVATSGRVYTGRDETGRMTLVTLTSGTRYAFATSDDLRRISFYKAVRSGVVQTSDYAEASLTLFDGDMAGGFYQATVQPSSHLRFWSDPWVGSLLLTSTPPALPPLSLWSFRELFQARWESEIDGFFAEQSTRDRGVRRVGEPVFSWDFKAEFDVSTLSQNVDAATLARLDYEHKFLKVHQAVILDPIPQWGVGQWHAWLEYWILLYPTDGHIRAVVPGWQHWTDGSWIPQIHRQIDAVFDDEVGAGRGVLESFLNTELESRDKDITDVQEIYYLPGGQAQPLATEVRGNTEDDVTIVVLKRAAQ